MTQLFADQGVEDILQGVDSPPGETANKHSPHQLTANVFVTVKMQRKEEEVS